MSASTAAATDSKRFCSAAGAEPVSTSARVIAIAIAIVLIAALHPGRRRRHHRAIPHRHHRSAGCRHPRPPPPPPPPVRPPPPPPPDGAAGSRRAHARLPALAGGADVARLAAHTLE